MPPPRAGAPGSNAALTGATVTQSMRQGPEPVAAIAGEAGYAPGIASLRGGFTVQGGGKCAKQGASRFRRPEEPSFPMLRYRADIKTLIFVAIYFGLVALQWVYAPTS